MNNYNGVRRITLKNYNDNLIYMGGVRGQIPPPAIKFIKMFGHIEAYGR